METFLDKKFNEELELDLKVLFDNFIYDEK